MLAGAFEDSTIRLWHLNNQSKDIDKTHDGYSDPSEQSSSDVNISHVHLSGDHIEDVQTKIR